METETTGASALTMILLVVALGLMLLGSSLVAQGLAALTGPSQTWRSVGQGLTDLTIGLALIVAGVVLSALTLNLG